MYVCLLRFCMPKLPDCSDSSCRLPLCALATWHRQQLKVYYVYYECWLSWCRRLTLKYMSIRFAILALCLSVCHQIVFFPPSWVPQARSEAWEVYPWELFPLDDPPRPSRPKAGLGLVMMMMMMMMMMCCWRSLAIRYAGSATEQNPIKSDFQTFEQMAYEEDGEDYTFYVRVVPLHHHNSQIIMI